LTKFWSGGAVELILANCCLVLAGLNHDGTKAYAHKDRILTHSSVVTITLVWWTDLEVMRYLFSLVTAVTA
jgi:hypothetical protein